MLKVVCPFLSVVLVYFLLFSVIVIVWFATPFPFLSISESIRSEVELSYNDNFDDVVKRYTEGAYSYFVDATTGEIIGGHTMDYIYSESVK